MPASFEGTLSQRDVVRLGAREVEKRCAETAYVDGAKVDLHVVPPAPPRSGGACCSSESGVGGVGEPPVEVVGRLGVRLPVPRRQQRHRVGGAEFAEGLAAEDQLDEEFPADFKLQMLLLLLPFTL